MGYARRLVASEVLRNGMNVLIFVGNGFDRALGLETGYDKFVAWYLRAVGQLDRPLLERSFCEYLVEGDKKTRDSRWAQFEEFLGVVPYDKLNSEPYYALQTRCEAIVGFTSGALQTYLTEQLANLPKVSVAAQNVLRENIKLFIQWALGAQEDIKLSYLTLNYTDTLERVLGVNVLHPHGSLQDGHIVFGIDNNAQFRGVDSRRIHEGQIALLKSEQAKLLGGEVKHAVGEALCISDCIVFFGVSFGITDYSWWSDIGCLMKRNSKLKVIVCPHADSRHMQDACMSPERCEEVRWRLSRYFSDKSDAVLKRIIIPPLEPLDYVQGLEPGDFWGLKMIAK